MSHLLQTNLQCMCNQKALVKVEIRCYSILGLDKKGHSMRSIARKED